MMTMRKIAIPEEEEFPLLPPPPRHRRNVVNGRIPTAMK
jgi:hypothetical protein